MKFCSGLLCGALCATIVSPAVANVATTAGSNLTAYNGTGAMNNNQWNSLMNGRAGMAQNAAEANFGNCNAVVLRCASPKCASGGCVDPNIASAIVAGCVNTNESCKQYGNDLVQYIAAQVVAQSTAKVQEQQNAVAIAQAQAEAQAAASATAAEQNNAQMQQMQSQMAAMQQQMADSMAAMQEQMAASAESQKAQIQNALQTQNSYATAPINTGDTGAVIAGLEGLSVAEQLAAKNGISADILVREQMGGKIETAIEDAMVKMKELKVTLDSLISYAECDAGVTDCKGPKRVKKFKDMANEFFGPYEEVLDNMYDALILAMTLGIDVSDVIMLLSDSCNIWGKFLCNPCPPPASSAAGNYEDTNTHEQCVCNNKDTKTNEWVNCYYRVKTDNTDGHVLTKQPNCRMVGTIGNKEEVWHEWVDPNSGIGGSIQVACASDIIGDISIFSGIIKRKKTKIDIETLHDLINQDAYSTCKTPADPANFDVLVDCGANRCNVDPKTDTQRISQLRTAASTKKLPVNKSEWCFPTENKMKNFAGGGSSNNEMATITPTIDFKVSGLTSNIDSCNAYLTETACGFLPDDCIWLSASQKCVSNGLTFSNPGLTNGTTSGTTAWQNKVLNPDAPDPETLGTLQKPCSSYSSLSCPPSRCRVSLTGGCVNK